MANYVVGISGGSGAPYTRRVIEGLVEAGHDAKIVVTDAGRRVFEIELGIALTGDPTDDTRILTDNLDLGSGSGSIELFDQRNVAATIASGSYECEGMVVVPCSMGTLARIATGISSNLLERAADAALKERRRLILVPRETPLNLIHLRNMTAVTEAGAIVMPAMPGFYHLPESVNDLVDMIAGRVLDGLGVNSTLLRRWQGTGD
ncbi:MAG TPA: UbiX family flavin prenyltransferase [Dehalococcoidia bacterium]|jgi:4-hydroxy-3-polyprenylbenzoate decarboxylase|nr:UbiX family flavin prenyltransferase [Dehalococcoidia bacterium]